MGKSASEKHTLRWREQQGNLAKLKGFSTEIEMCRLTRHYPAEAIKAMLSLQKKLSPLALKILPERFKSERELLQRLKDALKRIQPDLASLPGVSQQKAGAGTNRDNKSYQERLQQIIEVLKNWQKSGKDLEATKQALSPLEVTYEILNKNKDWGRKTQKALEWLDVVIERKSAFCGALLNELASLESPYKAKRC